MYSEKKKRNYNVPVSLARGMAICLLLFNSIGAFYGGMNLIIHPDGSGIHLDPALLAHTPFPNYFIPGIILVIANGVLSIAVLFSLLLNHPMYYLHVTFEGCILLGWLFIQILLIRRIDVLHYIMGATGLGLIISGLLIFAKNSPQKKKDI